MQKILAYKVYRPLNILKAYHGRNFISLQFETQTIPIEGRFAPAFFFKNIGYNVQATLTDAELKKLGELFNVPVEIKEKYKHSEQEQPQSFFIEKKPVNPTNSIYLNICGCNCFLWFTFLQKKSREKSMFTLSNQSGWLMGK